MSSRPSHSSPLSPTIKTQPIPIPRDDKSKNQNKPRQTHKPLPPPTLNIAALPKFHPGRFGNESGDNSPLSPRTIQNLRPAPSSAQTALQKYQRDIVTKASGLSELAKPTSPRLIPEGSPAGSLTPLALEAQSDYFLNRKMPASPAEARRLVDDLLKKENEKRDHPEARGGENSPVVTPPV